MRWSRRPKPTHSDQTASDGFQQLFSHAVTMEERDRARRVAVALEQENAHLTGFLHWLRDDLQRGGVVHLTLDDLVQSIDGALEGVRP